MTPPTFDILNIQTWKVKMSLFLKGLGIHVYLVTIKDSYVNDSNYIEANSKAIHALKCTLNDEYLSRISNIDSAFVTWNIITSLDERIYIMPGEIRMLEATPPTCAIWSKGINP